MHDFVALLATHGPLVVFVATLVTRLGAPVPAVPFLIVAGGLSVSGQVSFVAVLIAAVAGNILGDGVWFLAGRRWGYRVMRLLCRISLSADSCVKRSESILGRWGGVSLIVAKFVPGVSVVAPPMAGAMGMSNARFLSYETVAALIWTLGFLIVGRIFNAAIQDVLSVLSRVGLTAAVVCAIALLVFVTWRYHLRRIALRADDIPRIDVETLLAGMSTGDGPLLIDVRTAEAQALDGQTIPGAVSIELKRLPKGLRPLAHGRELVVFCDCPGDASAVAAARLLIAAGLPRVSVLEGGLDAWAESDHWPEVVDTISA